MMKGAQALVLVLEADVHKLLYWIIPEVPGRDGILRTHSSLRRLTRPSVTHLSQAPVQEFWPDS